MKTLLNIAVATLCVTLSVVHAAEPTTGEEALRQNLLVRHPVPQYPYEALRLKLTGSGLYQLKFDYDTGRLREVHVVRPCGKPVLDEASIAALKLWQAKPKSLHTILQPVTFWGP